MTVDLSDASPPEVTGPGVTEVGEQNLENVVRVRYSDERRLLRWEFTHTTSMLYRFDGRFISQGGQPSRSERSLTLRH